MRELHQSDGARATTFRGLFLISAISPFVLISAISPFGPSRQILQRKQMPAFGSRRRMPQMTRLTDTVEKGKNELTEIFPCAPVETGIS
jgi:hypothetical protein